MYIVDGIATDAKFADFSLGFYRFPAVFFRPFWKRILHFLLQCYFLFATHNNVIVGIRTANAMMMSLGRFGVYASLCTCLSMRSIKLYRSYAMRHQGSVQQRERSVNYETSFMFPGQGGK